MTSVPDGKELGDVGGILASDTSSSESQAEAVIKESQDDPVIEEESAQNKFLNDKSLARYFRFSLPFPKRRHWSFYVTMGLTMLAIHYIGLPGAIRRRFMKFVLPYFKDGPMVWLFKMYGVEEKEVVYDYQHEF